MIARGPAKARPSRKTVGAALAADTSGLALIEFAMVLPVLMILYLAGFQLGDGIACSRKVTIATRAVADLVAQNLSGTTSAVEVQGSLAAASQILAPYDTSNAVVRITEVATDASRRTTVQWSRASDASAYRRGDPVVIPDAMRIQGTYLLYAEVRYAYRPLTRFGFLDSLDLKDSLYMLPRNSSRIDCADC